MSFSSIHLQCTFLRYPLLTMAFVKMASDVALPLVYSSRIGFCAFLWGADIAWGDPVCKLETSIEAEQGFGGRYVHDIYRHEDLISHSSHLDRILVGVAITRKGSTSS